MVTVSTIKLVFVRKIEFVYTKFNRNCCHQSCTFGRQYAPNRLSAAASPRPHWGSSQCSRYSLTVFRGLLLKGEERRGWEGEGRKGERKGGRGSLLYEEKSRLQAFPLPSPCFFWTSEVGTALSYKLEMQD